MADDAPARPARVVLTGSESTGKTELARALAAHFGAPWSSEHVRAYLEARAAPLDARDVAAIAAGQIAGEDAALARAVAEARALAIHDTDVNSTVVYARYYYALALPWLDAAGAARRADLYLLCDIDAPWVADAQRDRPHERAAIQALFRARLAEIGATVVEVRGGWDARFVIARSAIEALVAGD